MKIIDEKRDHNTFVRRADRIIQKYSSKNAFTYMRNDGRKNHVTFKDVGEYFNIAKDAFINMGLIQGDRVAIICPHSPYAVFTGMALVYYGITIVLIDASLPIEEIEKLLAFSDVRAVFTVHKIYDVLHDYIIDGIPCFEINDKLAIKAIDKDKSICQVSTKTKDPEYDVIAILFSSGTTGQMKGIKQTYRSVLTGRNIFVKLSGLKSYMTYLLVLPFNHIAGFHGAMTYFLTGCELGFIEEPDASKLGTALKEFQPYYFAMVPKVYEVIQDKISAAIQEKGKVISSAVFGLMKLSGFLRKNYGINIGKKLFGSITASAFGSNMYGIGTGASPCKKETAEFFLNLGLEWSNLYATTETSVPIVATGILDRYPDDTVGNINAHPEIKIRIKNKNSEGNGEITVKSELMMKGYFRRDDLTAAAFDKDGYFLTGDYGFIDKSGYLHITGRVKDSIVLRNGKKVSPDDVDNYYTALIPDIKIASKGFENKDEMCDEIHIFIETNSFSRNEIRAFTEKLKIESRKAPSMYKIAKLHYIEQIPKTPVGKVKRYLLTADNTLSTNDKTDICAEREQRLFEILMKHTDVKSIERTHILSYDLGMDSLTIFEVITEIEQIYGIDISTLVKPTTTVEELLKICINQKAPSSIEYPLPKTSHMLKTLKYWIEFSKRHYDMEVIGAENIPNKNGYIICSNHASYFDPIWILAAMGKKADLNGICCMASIHTMKGKISKSIFEALGGIPVDREYATIPAASYAKRCLTKGRTIIIFPEGKRSRDGSMLPFKYGAAELALTLDRKILPVRIEGSYEIFSRWRKTPKLYNFKNHRKYPLKITFGESIEPQGTVEELTKVIEDRINILNIKTMPTAHE